MNFKQIILLTSCLLLFSQCASLRKSESQSWGKAKKEWKQGEDGKVKVSEASPRERRTAPASSAKMSQQKVAPTAEPAASLPSAPAVQPAPQYSKELFAGMISEEMWEELFPNRLGRGANIGKRDFYSFAAFKEAAKHFPRFLNEGDEATRRRELAAFLAHLTQETGGFRYLEQITITRSYSVANKEYPPVAGKDYHGRGPIQLSYNYNYGQFSKAYFGDKNVLLRNPELLVTDSVISFGSAIWFWMTRQPPKPACHDVIVGSWQPQGMELSYANRQPGFGLTLNIINASQCGKESEHADKRYGIYDSMCKYFGTTKGKNSDCIDQLPYGKKSW